MKSDCQKMKKAAVFFLLLNIVGLGGAGLGLTGCVASFNNLQKKMESKTKPIKLTQAQVTLVKGTLNQNFPDIVPFRYRNMMGGKTEDGRIVACGEFNSKTALGGYTGFQPFYGEIKNVNGKTYFMHISTASAAYVACAINHLNLPR